MLFSHRRRQIEAERDAARRDAAAARRRIADLEKAAAAVTERDRVLRDIACSRLLVFLTEGGVFDGLFIDADPKTLVFADVRRRADSSTWTAAAPGEIYVDRAKVLYLQRVTADQPRGD
jgi:hypothetical protein